MQDVILRTGKTEYNKLFKKDAPSVAPFNSNVIFKVDNLVKVNLTSIIDGIEFQGDEAQSYLNKLSGEVITITDEEIQIAENKEDASDYADWMKEAINNAVKYLEDEENYIMLPTKYDFNEYRIMEKFVLRLPIEKQRDEMYSLIKGKGTFSKFRWGLERFLLKDMWFEYRDNAFNEFAKDWCEDNDIEVKST